MLKKFKSKAFYIMLTVTVLLLASACLASTNWSYIIECSNSLNETTVGVLNKTGLACVRYNNG